MGHLSAAVTRVHDGPHHGPWRLADLAHVPRNGLKVFSCFHCGGGSTMGYKLAGCNVLGGVEIDPKMMELYRRNHNPRRSYLMGVQEFRKLRGLPEDLFSLDILDGSPPCSNFSMVGVREKGWGKEKVFREGQAKQVLSDLFFDFIDVAAMLRPRVVIAENVKGMLLGRARGYVKQIFAAFAKAGYDTQLFLLNAGRMGVPQARPRVFFVATRRDLAAPKLVLDFNEPEVPVSAAWADLPPQTGKHLNDVGRAYWAATKPGQLFNPEGRPHYSHRKLHPGKPASTQISSSRLYHWAEPRHLSRMEALRLQTFPDDYDFLDQDPVYVCGMSVPPYMMERVARAVAEQLLLQKET